MQMSVALVAHICNPSYSGSRNQEDQDSNPAQASSLRHRILKKSSTKKSWWSGSSVSPAFKPQYCKKKKKKKKEQISETPTHCEYFYIN
jgi:hypothetical protein